MEELCRKYDELYDILSEVLRDAAYIDMAICDGLSAGIDGSLPHAIGNRYLPFFEHVVSKGGYYDGGYSAAELLNFVYSSVLKANTSFSLVEGLEAPLSLITIYLIEGKLESAEYFFARDQREAENEAMCDAGYKVGIGFNGKDFLKLKYNIATEKVTKRKFDSQRLNNDKSDVMGMKKATPDEFSIKDGRLVRYKGKAQFIEIPAEVTTIAAEAFYGNKHIKNVILPEGVTFIGHDSFSGCIALESVVISNSVTRIGANAFAGCLSLAHVVLSTSLKNIDYGMFWGCVAIKSLVIPESVKMIGARAFSGCSSLDSITFPVSIKEICDSAFADCISITEIEFPKSLTTIGKAAFSDCYGLIKIKIPASVKEIQEGAFRNCKSIKEVFVDEKNKNYKAVGGKLYTKDGHLVV